MVTARRVPLPAEAAAQALSSARLATVVRSEQATSEPLRELIRRRPAALRQTLEDIVADSARPAEQRTIAAVGLGSLYDGRSIDALLAAANSADASLARRAVEALGRVGTPDTLRALESIAVPAGPARGSLAFARSLIAYRHGLAGHRVTLPRKTDITTVEPTRAQPLPVHRLAPQAWAELRASLREVPAAAAPTDRPPLELRCGQDRLLLFVNPAIEGQAPARAFTRQVVAAVLMKWSMALRRWFIVEYFFAHPQRGAPVQVIGVRPTGTVVHAGTASLDAASVRIALQALDGPLAAPTRVDAVVAAGQELSVEALVEADRSRNRNPPRLPKQAAQPR